MYKYARNTIHHRWSNNPDINHRKCLVCGILKTQKTINGKNVSVYTLNDGTQTEQIPDCITSVDYSKL